MAVDPAERRCGEGREDQRVVRDRGRDCLPADDPGADIVLSEYAKRRQPDRAQTLAFSDGLAKLTANDAPMLRPLRSAGFAVGDSQAWLQGWLVGGAMGYRGDVPALCRKLAVT